MCGFAGIVNFTSPRPPAIDEALLRRMGEPVAHRGPDGTGVWISPDGRAGLIHHRLAIVDLDAGHQPMSNEDGTVWIVFNGEIYNHPELRAELAAAGHAFKSDHSDTEVIVHAWEQWGRDCPARLRGQFAFAIVDLNKQGVFLARDRLGQKPLYRATLAGGTILFASSPRCLLAHPDFPGRAEPVRAYDYLSVGYMPEGFTMWPGMGRMEPAATHVDSAGDASDGTFWTPPTRPFGGSVDDARRQLRDAVIEAVELRLRADVEVGCFLSGGVDSAVIASIVRRELGRDIRTFTIGTPDPKYDEREPAWHVAEALGADHTELVVDPDHLLEVLDDLVETVAEPFSDSSVIPTHWVAKLTRQHVKVALSGDAGDECFGGYNRYRAMRLAGRLRWSRPLWRAAWPMVRRMGGGGGFRNKRIQIQRLVRGLCRSPAESYRGWVGRFGEAHLRRLIRPEFQPPADHPDRMLEDLQSELARTDPVQAAMRNDLAYYLPGDILTKVDRASMAVALEVRSPFLDHKVVELAVSLPSRWKLRGRRSKWILREAFKDIVPPHVWDQPKRGFALPLDRWFRPSASGQPARLDGLLRESVAFLPDDVFNHDYINELIARHQSGREEHSQRLWALLWLGRWWRRFLG